MSWKPRLRTILLIINLVILLLPLFGIGVLRLYESELIRRTESELIAQGTLVSAAYREALLLLPPNTSATPSPSSSIYGTAITYQQPKSYSSQKYHPIAPKLDISTEIIRPPAPLATAPETLPDHFALQAAKKIEPLLIASKDVTLVGIRLLDFRGTVIGSTGSENGQSLINREEVRRSLTGEYVSLLRQRVSDEPQPVTTSASRGKRLRVFVAMPVVSHDRVIGAVLLSRTPLDIRKSLYMVRGQLAIAAAGLVCVVLIITVITSVTVNRPLKSLVKHAERIVHGEKVGAVPADNSGILEIGQLSQAVSAMAKTLEDRAEYIRTFAANVSHEFKTPLTSIRGTVELLDEHFAEMSPEERSRFLQIIFADTERLDRLVRRLLDLARADTFTPGDERTDVLEVFTSLAKRYQGEGISIVVEHNKIVSSIRMARETFESIMSNMVENARQHSGNDVSIHIRDRIIDCSDGALFEVDIQDNGPGIPEMFTEKIFRPFFTTAREKGSSGLGLSIVRSLLAAHGGSITLEPGDIGTLFRIRIPV